MGRYKRISCCASYQNPAFNVDALLLAVAWLFAESRTTVGDLFALLLAALGARVFALWVFRVIDDLIAREAQARAKTEAVNGQMRARMEHRRDKPWAERG